jgi:hypothetical protein
MREKDCHDCDRTQKIEVRGNLFMRRGSHSSPY